jgi:hypothetical protein
VPGVIDELYRSVRSDRFNETMAKVCEFFVVRASDDEHWHGEIAEATP